MGWPWHCQTSLAYLQIMNDVVAGVAVAVWFAGLLLISPVRDALSTNDIAVAAVVTIITWTIYGFARHSRQRGWLR